MPSLYLGAVGTGPHHERPLPPRQIQAARLSTIGPRRWTDPVRHLTLGCGTTSVTSALAGPKVRACVRPSARLCSVRTSTVETTNKLVLMCIDQPRLCFRRSVPVVFCSRISPFDAQPPRCWWPNDKPCRLVGRLRFLTRLRELALFTRSGSDEHLHKRG